ncbi:putative membrane protein [Vibrio cholerae]|nr:putative membrane protein [Vibrio cholerae]
MNRSIYRQFVRYTIPTVAAMLVNGLYQVVDGIFIGHYVGAEGLAGINVAWPVIGTILGIGMLVGVGTGALASIKQGEGHPDSAKRILATGLMSLLLLAPIVAVILWFMADDFLRWQGAEGRVFELGLQYLQVLLVGCLFTLGSIAMPFLLRNDHSPNLATLLMVIGALTNIALDYLFIAWLQWELTGAAIATTLAQVVGHVIRVGVFLFCPSQYAFNSSLLKVGVALVTQDLRDWRLKLFYVCLWFYHGCAAQHLDDRARQCRHGRRLCGDGLYRDDLLPDR